MKCRFIQLVVLSGIWTLTTLAAEDVSSLLQKGLFEEEANHNLNAAIDAYESVVARFDKDRKLAATAVFRLGECYRKQNKTNEAAAQFERVLKEFTDQQPLLGPSRDGLALLGRNPPAPEMRKERERSGMMGVTLAELQAADRERAQTMAETEEVKRIQAMIKDSPDLINARGEDGTPLHSAAGKGQLIVAKYLLESGADLEARDTKGRTPLERAAEAGHRTMVELLLDHKAILNPAGKEDTALHLAATQGFKSVVDLLLARGADVNARDRQDTTPLQEAVNADRKAVVEALLAAHADVNAADKYQRTALHYAAAMGRDAMVILLLDHGAEINATDSTHSTPLASAVNARRLSTVKILLERKADPNIPILAAATAQASAKEYAPLNEAAESGEEEICRWLLEHGANPNTFATPNGSTPLLTAVLKVNARLTALLLRHGANPDIRNTNGEGPLHVALAQAEILRLMLDAHAHVNITNSLGETPLHFAVGAGLTNVAALLVERGADVNARDAAGQTPLHWAAGLSDFAMTKLLLAHGADPNVQDNNNQTPLEWSQRPVSYGQSVMGPGFAVRRPWAPSASGGPAVIRTPRAPGFPNAPTSSPLAELLLKSGAVVDPPRPNQISARRSMDKPATILFNQSTNDWNYFTVLDVLGVLYGFLGGSPGSAERVTSDLELMSSESSFPYPDLAHLTIRRPDGAKWTEEAVDLSALLSQKDCSKNVPIPWGGILQIPEADHVLNQRWKGFSEATFEALNACWSRIVDVRVRGKSNLLTLKVEVEAQPLPGKPSHFTVNRGTPMWLKPVLLNSKLLLSSSDLSRVKVTRTHPVTGKKVEYMVDCSEGKPAPDLWLRDGDVIEIGEKE